ncbi:MAG: 3-phosphoshikimate 1-carboxyvinyltransferase [Candidatus Izemoplasmatales bacterium]|nr:3-phosphoshikimate 1-carboxyvinyltransferase [Candidatus Izemoplasmatales bacterium]
MKVRITPGYAEGNIQVPPSKSILHRAIICASLAKGSSTIRNIIFSDDVKATINAFKALGVQIIKEENALKIKGYGNLNFFGEELIDCNESGSTIRFLIPLFCNKNGIRFTGKSSLLNRPMYIYEKIFKEKNLRYKKQDGYIYVEGEIKAGDYVIPGNVSSQFITGLLFTLPLKDGDSKIIIEGNLESKKYIDMTIEVLKQFGIDIIENQNIYYIKGNQKYLPSSYKVEGDFSQLAFFAVAGIINGNVKVTNINLDSNQADIAIIDIIKTMGGKISKEKNGLRFLKSETTNIDIDVSQHPDIAPILSILCAMSKNKGYIYNAQRLKIKETDRLKAINVVLNELGIKTEINNDSYYIYGNSIFRSAEIDSHNDHRIVMSAAIAALRADKSIIINNYEAVNKSYPHFFEDLSSLGIKVEYI